MKKRVKAKKNLNISRKSFDWRALLIILGIVVLLVIAIGIIKTFTGRAIDPTNVDDPLGIGLNPDNIPETPEDAKDVATNYLKQEWSKILENTDHPVGKFIWGIHKVMVFLSPAFKVIIGIEYSFSWLFLLTLVIWITLVVYFYRILSVFSTFSKGVSFVISLCVIIIGSIAKIPLTLANFIIKTISVLTSWWMQLIAIVLLIVFLILISTFSKEWEIMVKKWRENRKKMKQEMDVIEAKVKADAAYETTKALGRAFED